MEVKQVASEITLVHGFMGPEGETKTIKFRKGRAGDLKIMDGKGDHEGMIAFSAALAGLTPRMVEGMDLEDYAMVMREVRRFLSVLKDAVTS